MSTEDHSPKKLLKFAIFYWAAVFAALIFWSWDWAVFRGTSVRQDQLFEIFGFCIFCVLAYITYSDIKSQPHSNPQNWILRGLPFLVSLFFLAQVMEMSQKSWDYHQYETAFRDVAAGDNPYLSTRYLYPPFFTDTMTSIYKFGMGLLPLLGLNAKPADGWTFVFFIHQASLYFFLILSFTLSLKLSHKLGLNRLTGTLFSSALFLLNVPVLRTISYNQVNFYILAATLGAMLAVSAYPIISGAIISFGGMIKLYPFVLLAPAAVTKKWKLLFGSLITAGGIIFIETKFLSDLLHWKQFALFYTSFPMERESSKFRNTSPLSFLRSLIDLLKISEEILFPVFIVIFLGILAWFAHRFFQRERIYFDSLKNQTELIFNRETFRDIGHLVDFSVLSLLLAPSAWEHHYVIAIPLAIWVFAIHKNDLPWMVGIGLVGVFLLPVFNVFPISYARMLGLIFLLIQSSPKIVLTKSKNKF